MGMIVLAILGTASISSLISRSASEKIPDTWRLRRRYSIRQGDGVEVVEEGGDAAGV